MHPFTRLALALTVAAAGCSGNAIGFDITHTIAEQTIPGDPVAHAAAEAALTANPAAANALSLEWTSDSPPTSTSGAQRVDLVSMQLTITTTSEPDGDKDCFDFIHTVTVAIESTQQGSTLPRQVIANATDPGCTSTLQLQPVAGIDVGPYAREGFRIVVDATGIPPADDVSFNGVVVLRAGIV